MYCHFKYIENFFMPKFNTSSKTIKMLCKYWVKFWAVLKETKRYKKVPSKNLPTLLKATLLLSLWTWIKCQLEGN